MIETKSISKYRDRFGVIVQRDGDGGDTCNRIGMLYGCLSILQAPDDMNRPPEDGFCITEARLAATLPTGRYRRHPDSSKWYSNINNVTRDQMSPMICAMVLNGTTTLLIWHFKARLKRGLLHFSTQDQVEGTPGKVRYKLPDLPSPMELAAFIRGFGKGLCLLPLLDRALLYEAKKANAENIREGQLILHLAVSKLYPTAASKKALELVKTKVSELAIGIRNYHSEAPGHNGIEPLGEITVAALEAL